MENNYLVKKVLIDPIFEENNELIIIAGYASANMLSWYIKKLNDLHKNIKVKLIVGMTRTDGIAMTDHNSYKKMCENNNVEVSYVYQNKSVHSKIYIWLKNGKIGKIYVGSVDFTQSGFSNSQKETIVEVDDHYKDSIYCFFREVIKDTVYCTVNDIDNYVNIHAIESRFEKNNKLKDDIEENDMESIKLSLLTANGEIPQKSGINWGQRPGRNKNQAYIALPSKIARSGFFPLGKEHFTVITDDQKELILRVEQENDKAITTPLGNQLLGEYLRGRLGVKEGEFITKNMLLNYGRTDITFYKIDDENYYLDFSI